MMEHFSLGHAVHVVKSKAHPDGLYIEDIIATFGSRSHAFLILFFCLPFAQPLPLLGLSTPFGLSIMILGFYQALEKRPWLPKKILRRHIKPNFVISCCNVLEKILAKTEKLIKPRHGYWFGFRMVRFGNGILIAIFAILLALPLPVPFSNTVPAYVIIVNSIGWLERDGVLVFISYFMAVLGALFFVSIGAGTAGLFEWFNNR